MSDYIVTPFHTDCAACDSNADTALFNARAENLPSLKRWYGGEVPGLPELSTVAHGVEVTRKASEPFELGRYVADGGDVGGDAQVGIAPTRAFAQKRADGTFTVITEYAYAERIAEDRVADGYRYDVVNQTEVMHCRDLDDIGGTEITSETTYEHPGYFAYKTRRQAESYARSYIKSLDITHYGWQS